MAADFTVIIIGGSISGLTLANILEKYSINYVLLEKHRYIAPHVGASIGVHPNGFYILHQLGLGEKVESLSELLDGEDVFGPDGTLLASNNQGQLSAELTGYKVGFLERRELIQALYDNLSDKSKVHQSKELRSIEQLDSRVRVTTTDGTTIIGSILVAADGVHSKTRDEIWRIANSEDPGYGTQRMAQSMSCTHRCLFGIADRPEVILPRISNVSYHKNRSHLLIPGGAERAFFFVFINNQSKVVNSSIPRYTADDEYADAADFADDILLPGVRFGDVYKRRLCAALVPAEEYLLEKCFYQRAILIGDALHKLNPITGRGGNSAIEGAALLGDFLKGLIENSPQPADDMIHLAFSTFQQERQSRLQPQLHEARQAQRRAALENPFLHFLSLSVTPRMTIDKFAPGIARNFSASQSLRYLPRPPQRGIVLLDQDVIANPRQRSLFATALWITTMFFTAALATLLHGHYRTDQISDESDIIHIYNLAITTTVTGLWTLESYRPGLFMTPLYSTVPYIIASLVFGWETILPIYFAMYIYKSSSRPFYYPDPRAIDLRAAKSLPIGALVMSCAFILLTLMNVHWAYLALHFIIPFAGSLGQHFSKTESPASNVVQSLYGNQDMHHLSRFFNVLILANGTTHGISLYWLSSQGMKSGFTARIFDPSCGVQLACLALAIIIWCYFTAWDLRRTNAIQVPLPVVLAFLLLGTVALGPAATLATFWKWREVALESSRASNRSQSASQWRKF